MSYLEERRNMKLFGKKPDEKKPYSIPKQSEKKKKEIEEAKAAGTDKEMDKFFNEQRPKMTGVCQCGCGEKSQKKDDTFFRHCICHIFPKSVFKSIATHPLNWVERKFWGGDHTNFDEGGMDKWPLMADWDDIKTKFRVLEKLLTEQEKSKKFYNKLKDLVEKN